MAVYVDTMRAKYGRMVMCHMLADSTDELLEMADKIGVARRWLQHAGEPHEHFDIALSKRALAVEAGATEVGRVEMVEMLLRRRGIAIPGARARRKIDPLAIDPVDDLLLAADLSDGSWLIKPVWVPGTPRPQGSKKAFVRPGQRYPSMVESAAGLEAWRSDVRTEVGKSYHHAPLDGPIEVAVIFLFRRPLAHFIAGRRDRQLKPYAPIYHAQDPDCDKLCRGVADALAGIAWVDDNRIARWHGPTKLWALRSGAWLTFRSLE